MSGYELDNKGFKKDSEMTSAISAISYEIENGLHSGLSIDDIDIQLEYFQSEGIFPPNLKIVDAFYDKKTSLSGVAFKNTDTGMVTVGMAGTNFDNGIFQSSKDLVADISIVLNGPTGADEYFSQGNKFISNLKKKYPIEAITGHSKGGRDAVVLGVEHNIPAIVTYNPAPITNDILYYMNSFTGNVNIKDRFNSSYEMKKDFFNYKGDIIHFVSNKDQLTGWADFFKSFYTGDRYVIDNNKDHGISGFLGEKEQEFINSHLLKHTKLGTIRGLEMSQIVTGQELKKLFDIKNKFLQNNNGSLSSSQEIFLDASEAIILTKGIKGTIEMDIYNLQTMYRQSIEKSNQLWKDTISKASNIGSKLSYNEVLESLEKGNVTNDTLLTKPVGKYEKILKKLHAIQEKYNDFIKNINDAIETQLSTDQDLARQLRGM
ncbi:MAG: hypothetical protein KFW09_01615 [Oscillospiraceae bacterium]|nr:hypothetical protein [Oscillospiraceae bacterium]